jgi:hypothetical protein
MLISRVNIGVRVWSARMAVAVEVAPEDIYMAYRLTYYIWVLQMTRLSKSLVKSILGKLLC